MRKQRIEYDSPVDALVMIAKRLQSFENCYKMTSEEFYNTYSKGKLDDTIDFTEWSNDYQHYLAIRSEIESFPHHKHTQRLVLAVARPSIHQVIEEALNEMNKV